MEEQEDKRCRELVMRGYTQGRCSQVGSHFGYCKQHIPKELRGDPSLTLYRVKKFFLDVKDALPEPVRAIEVTDKSYINEYGNRVHRESGHHVTFDRLHDALRYSKKALMQRRAQAAASLKKFDDGLAELDKFMEKHPL